MSWAALFERAADCSVTEAQIREHLAGHRDRPDATGEEEVGGR